MMQEDYDNLVNSLATKLLEEGPEKAADNEDGPSTPNAKPLSFESEKKTASEKQTPIDKQNTAEKAKTGSLLAGAAIIGSDEALGLFRRLFGPRHFGSHAALEGQTSGKVTN